MNASCASGIFLGACVYQCLLTHPSPPGAVVVSRKRGRCCLFKRGGGVWALPVHTHGHPPKSRPAYQTTFVPTIATLDLVSLGLVRCGCGKSVTGHHRQRDGSRRMPASIHLVLRTLFGRTSSAAVASHDAPTKLTESLVQRATSLGPDAHKRTR